jgi:DNA-binding MarR family transcriptional regulator
VSTTKPNRYSAAAHFRTELRHFLRRSEDCARAFGVTPRQYLLLLQIAGSDEETLTVSELVPRLALTQSAVTELVQRRPSTVDGRVSELRLTDEGARRLAGVHDALGPERERLLALLDNRE